MGRRLAWFLLLYLASGLAVAAAVLLLRALIRL